MNLFFISFCFFASQLSLPVYVLQLHPTNWISSGGRQQQQSSEYETTFYEKLNKIKWQYDAVIWQTLLYSSFCCSMCAARSDFVFAGASNANGKLTESGHASASNNAMQCFIYSTRFIPCFSCSVYCCCCCQKHENVYQINYNLYTERRQMINVPFTRLKTQTANAQQQRTNF